MAFALARPKPNRKLWHMMSNIIYANGQFTRKNDLIKAIEDAANVIKNEKKSQIKSLFDSFPRRLSKVIQLGGKLTNY